MSIQLTVMSLDFETNVAPSTTTYTKRQITLGRSPDNDVILNLPEVSGKHAVLLARKDESGRPSLFIKDLGSSNGTLVENNYIDSESETRLMPNQRIKIGRFLIKPFLNAEEFDSLENSENGAGGHEIEESDPTSEVFFSNEEPVTEAVEGTAVISEPTFIMHRSELNEATQNGSHEFSDEEESSDVLLSPGTDDAGVSGEGSESDDALSAEDFNESSSGDRMAHADSFTSREGANAEVTLPTTEDVDYGAVSGSLLDSDATDLDFIALELFTVSGRVMHKGSPVEDVEVRCQTLGTTYTDSNGEFSFENVAETTAYSISLKKKKYRFLCDELEGAVDGNISVEAEAQRLFSISGRVVHRGAALAGVEIDAGELGTTTTDANGYYEFRDVPEDTEYKITASKDGYVFGTRRVRR